MLVAVIACCVIACGPTAEPVGPPWARHVRQADGTGFVLGRNFDQPAVLVFWIVRKAYPLFWVVQEKLDGLNTVLQENLAGLSLESPNRIIRWDLTKNLNRLLSTPQAFDLVFLDPPYNKNLIIPALDHLRLSQSLENGARIIVEHSQLEPVEPDRTAFEMVDQRRYGKTLVSFLNYVV